MTYAELLETWKRYDSEWRAYQDSVYVLVSTIAGAMKSHLKLPNLPVFRIIPTDTGRPDDGKIYAPPTAVAFDESGVATVTFEIILRSANEREAQLYFFLDLNIVKQKSRWNVRPFSKADTKILSDPPTPEELAELCAYTTAAMRKDFEGSVEDAIGKVVEKTVGFRVQS